MTEYAGNQTIAGGRSFLSAHADNQLKFQDLILSRKTEPSYWYSSSYQQRDERKGFMNGWMDGWIRQQGSWVAGANGVFMQSFKPDIYSQLSS